MHRCLYGRAKFIKCKLGESRNSITLNLSDSSTINQLTFNLSHRLLHSNFGISCLDTVFNNSSKPSSSNQVMPSAGTEKLDSFFVQNGMISDSTLRNLSISEGYYKKNGQQSGRNSETNGEKASKDRDYKCEFKFDSINIRLLETVGVLVSTFSHLHFLLKPFKLY